VLTVAPTPDHARRLRRTTLRAAVIRAGRQRGIDAEVERANSTTNDEWTEQRRYLGLDILAKSRLTKITNQNPTDEEVTITAITA
jgi:hypothetical protein